ncbi:MAG TPA: hypothetical protein VMV83_07375 [Rectinemataceae bacterium]|nr:hypothetical protein [Rectinemataceae bacterium]
MSQMIHYQDDLFLLSLRAKSLEAAILLDADPEFWKESLLRDIHFIDETSRAIADNLAGNRHLVDRESHLRLLERLSLDFSRALERLVKAATPLAQSVDGQRVQLQNIASLHRELAQDLAESLADDESTKDGDSSIVSGDELAKLLGEGPS